MKRNTFNKKKIIIMFIIFLLTILTIILYLQKIINRKKIVKLGLFSGSNWGTPNLYIQGYKFIDEAIDLFESNNPDIKIIYKSGILKDDYSEWLAKRILNGDEPDVFAVLSEDFNTLASIGIMKRLDNLIKGDDSFDIHSLYSNAIKAGKLQEVQYAIPIEIDPTLMFVNKSLLKKEGIPIPSVDWTWNDFFEICKKITKDVDGDGRIDQFGENGFNWEHAVYTNGRFLFDIKGKEAFFNDEKVMQAVEFAMKLDELYQNQKPLNFESGLLAFSPFTFSAYRTYKYYPYRIKKYGQFEWKFITLPKGPFGKNASEFHSFLFGISSRTKKEKEAWKFLKFLVNNEKVQTNIFKYSQGIPVLKHVLKSDIARRELSRYNPDMEDLVDTRLISEIIENSIVTPRFKKYKDTMDIADKEVLTIISENKNIRESLLKLNLRIKSLLTQ